MRPRSSALLVGPVLALVACAGPTSSPASGSVSSPTVAVAPRGAFPARVERVVDGDTFIAVRRGARVRVRLIGVDAPESVRPGYPVECWGRESARLLHHLVPPGSSVRAAYEPGGRRDRYGRDLWDVWLPDGRFVQAVLVRRGAAEAVAFPPQVARAAYLDGLEAAARSRGRGLWGACPT